LLSDSGLLKVADFGLSLSKDFWSLRKAKSRAGTPLYMSPEQIAGKPLDVRTDIYSLGNVLYELLTGRLPYRHDEKKSYMGQVVNRKVNPPPPSFLSDNVSGQFDEITMKALKKDLTERYQTIAEMMLDLKRLLPVLRPDDFLDQFNFMRDHRLSGSGAGPTPTPTNTSDQPPSAEAPLKAGMHPSTAATEVEVSSEISKERKKERAGEKMQSENAEPSQTECRVFPPIWERPGPGKALEMFCIIAELFPDQEQAGNAGEAETFADLEASEIEDLIFIGRG